MGQDAREDLWSSRRWLIPVLLPLLVGVAYSRALFGEFQQWDDVALLIDNPGFRGLSWAGLRWMFTTHLMGHYMPLTWVTYGLDHAVWGLKPFGYHVTNVALHGANTVLVYFLALRLVRIAWRHAAEAGEDRLRIGAAFAALAFGLHPLRVESVAWITERRDVLCGFFYLLAILMHLRAASEDGKGARSWRACGWPHWAAVGFFGLALLSKSMAVTLPVVLLVLDVYPLGRLRPGGGGGPIPGPWHVWREKIPFLVAAVLVSALAFRALWSGATATSWQRLGLMERLALSGYSAVFYLRKTLLPLDLSPLYELVLPVRVLDSRFLLSGAVVALISLATLALRRRFPTLLAVWIAYLTMLLPVAGIFHNGHQIVADRYSYLPCVGWTLLAGAALAMATAGRRAPPPQRPVVAMPVVVLAFSAVAVLGLIAWQQMKVWQNDETLWRHATRLDPGSSVAASNLGSSLRARGQLAEAIEQSQRALLLRPDYAEAYLNLGLAKTELGQMTEAVQHFRRALGIRPRLAPAHAGLGIALDAQGRTGEALEHLRLVLELNPGSAEAHNNLGVRLARSGHLPEAVAAFSEAVRIDPTFASAQNNLGLAMAQTGRLLEAADHFRAAIRARPNFPDAQGNLAEALRRLAK